MRHFIINIQWKDSEFTGSVWQDSGVPVDTSLSTLFLDEHVVETIALQEIDIGIDGSIAPVEE